MRWLGLMGVVAVVCVGCATPRVLSGREANASFVRERAVVYVESDAGLQRVGLDGSSPRDVFPAGYKLLDLGPDGHTFLLTDRDTNLIVGDGESGQLRQIPELSHRLATAALSPDGTQIAAARHADFRQPQGRWHDEDAVLLINLLTLSVDTIAPVNEALITRLAWSESGTALSLTTSTGESQWITLGDRKRVEAPTPLAPLRVPPTKPLSTCPSSAARLEADSNEAVLWLAEPGRPRRPIVKIGDGKRDPHEAEYDFSNLAFSPSCAYAVFVYQQQLWVTEIATGKVANLGPGFRAFVAPSAR
ncbi:MAG: hypothetical protein U0165_12920 [Polyangiaceae bacterium]